MGLRVVNTTGKLNLILVTTEKTHSSVRMH